MAWPNFVEKTFAGNSKTAKFVNVFSLESFPLYGMRLNTVLHNAVIINRNFSTINLKMLHAMHSVIIQCNYNTIDEGV